MIGTSQPRFSESPILPSQRNFRDQHGLTSDNPVARREPDFQRRKRRPGSGSIWSHNRHSCRPSRRPADRQSISVISDNALSEGFQPAWCSARDSAAFRHVSVMRLLEPCVGPWDRCAQNGSVDYWLECLPLISIQPRRTSPPVAMRHRITERGNQRMMSGKARFRVALTTKGN